MDDNFKENSFFEVSKEEQDEYLKFDLDDKYLEDTQEVILEKTMEISVENENGQE